MGCGVGGRWGAHFQEDWGGGWGKFVDFVMFFFLNSLMSLPKKKFWTQNLLPDLTQTSYFCLIMQYLGTSFLSISP